MVMVLSMNYMQHLERSSLEMLCTYTRRSEMKQTSFDMARLG